MFKFVNPDVRYTEWMPWTLCKGECVSGEVFGSQSRNRVSFIFQKNMTTSIFESRTCSPAICVKYNRDEKECFRIEDNYPVDDYLCNDIIQSKESENTDFQKESENSKQGQVTEYPFCNLSGS